MHGHRYTCFLEIRLFGCLEVSAAPGHPEEGGRVAAEVDRVESVRFVRRDRQGGPLVVAMPEVSPEDQRHVVALSYSSIIWKKQRSTDL